MVYGVCLQCWQSVVGHQEEHPARKNWVLRCWCGYLSGVRCRLFLNMVHLMPLHSQTPSSLASFRFRLVWPFWYWLTQVVLEKRLLNGCTSSSSLCLMVRCVWFLTSGKWSQGMFRHVVQLHSEQSFWAVFFVHSAASADHTWWHLFKVAQYHCLYCVLPLADFQLLFLFHRLQFDINNK